MNNLAIIILQLSPVLLYVILGVISVRIFKLPIKWVANLLFYLLVPIVIFKGTINSQIIPFLLLVSLTFLVCLLMALASSLVRNRFLSVVEPNTLKCIFGYFNIGWFGIPVAQVLYGHDGVNIITSLYIGGMLFGNTLGYLLTQPAETKQALPLKKLLGVPSVYAALLALGFHVIGETHLLMQTPLLNTVFDAATWLTSLFGMGLVGMSVATITRQTASHRLLIELLLMRTAFAAAIVYPLAVSIHWLGWISTMEFKVFCLMPLLPIAANLLVFTAQRETDNRFIGMTLLGSTLLSYGWLLLWILLIG